MNLPTSAPPPHTGQGLPLTFALCYGLACVLAALLLLPGGLDVWHVLQPPPWELLPWCLRHATSSLARRGLLVPLAFSTAAAALLLLLCWLYMWLDLLLILVLPPPPPPPLDHRQWWHHLGPLPALTHLCAAVAVATAAVWQQQQQQEHQQQQQQQWWPWWELLGGGGYPQDEVTSSTTTALATASIDDGGAPSLHTHALHAVAAAGSSGGGGQPPPPALPFPGGPVATAPGLGSSSYVWPDEPLLLLPYTQLAPDMRLPQQVRPRSRSG